MAITKTEFLPDITRQSVSSELILEIRECLLDSLNNSTPYKIDDLTDDKEFHNMQQRVRTQARKLGVNVTVRRAKGEDALYFQALDDLKSNAKTVDIGNDDSEEFFAN